MNTRQINAMNGLLFAGIFAAVIALALSKPELLNQIKAIFNDVEVEPIQKMKKEVKKYAKTKAGKRTANRYKKH